MWAEGQLKVPKTNGCYLDGDFNRDSEPEVAVLVEDDTGRKLLIVQSTDSGGKLQALIEIAEGDGLQWFDPALKVGKSIYVVWENNEYRTHTGREADINFEVIPQYQWLWQQNVNLLDYFLNYHGQYSIVINSSQDHAQDESYNAPQVEIKDAGKTVYSWETVTEGAFLINDHMLYYTQFSQISTGMTLVAYDLSAKKELWRSNLKGVGDVAHSGYQNWGAHLRFVDNSVIEAKGKELYTGYVEYVDRATGQSLGNKTFPL